MREIVYDTETTGKRYQDDHRITEIGAIEYVDGKATGRVFHHYVNPERSIPEEVVRLTGITDEKVAKAPLFRQIMPELLEFIRGARLIAHNAPFDEGFINHEMELAGCPESFWAVVGDTADTLPMSRRIWKGKDEHGKRISHSLDKILDRLDIDRSKRTQHGALIDSELLAEAYFIMRDKIRAMGPTLEEDAPRPPIVRVDRSAPLVAKLPIVTVSQEAAARHKARMKEIAPEEVEVAPSRQPKVG